MDDAYSLEYVLRCLSIPFLVIGFIGNVLVIRIVQKTREMHTPTNYLLVSIAISDIITILLWSLYLSDEFEKIVCKLIELIEVSIIVSSSSLTVLAVERYHAILKPFRTGSWLNGDHIKKTIAIIWISSVLICLPEFFFKKWSEPNATCIGPWTLYMNHASKVCVIVNAAVTFIQMAVMLYCYGSLMRGLYFTNTVCPETEAERRAEKRKLVTTFILVTFVFFLGYTPTAVSYAIIPSADKTTDLTFYDQLTSVADFVFVCSLCFNPIIYAFRSTNFKEGLKRTILCRKPPQHHDTQRK